VHLTGVGNNQSVLLSSPRLVWGNARAKKPPIFSLSKLIHMLPQAIPDEFFFDQLFVTLFLFCQIFAI